MDTIIKVRWVLLTLCVFPFFGIAYVKNVNFQTWLCFTLAMSLTFLLLFILYGIEKAESIINKNKFIKLLPWLVCFLIALCALRVVALLDPLPAPEFFLILYKISFFLLCALIILPIVKIPSSFEGIVTMNDRPIKKKRVSLISLYHLNLLPREFQTYYVIKKIFNNKAISEQKFIVKVNFSSEFLEKIRDIDVMVYLDQIIKIIQTQAESMIEQNNFNKPSEILRSNYSYFAEGKITVSYLS